MISSVGPVISGEGYGYTSGTRPAGRRTSEDDGEVRDRWIPGGMAESRGYGASFGADGIAKSEAEEAQIEDLKKRDSEVRQHEQSHAAMLGSYAVGPPIYYYQMGPDGRAYAVGGSVKVDMSSTGSEAADAAKALRIKAAASGVGDMSSADMAVAAAADKGLGFSATA